MHWNSGRNVLVALAFLTPVSARAQGAASTPVMSVGPNVQVTKQFSRLAHYESWAAGDPDHAGRLLTCSAVEHQEHTARGQHCYVSFDGGKTWTVSLELDKGPHNADPTLSYGRGDTVYAVFLLIPGDGPEAVLNRITAVYRSADGGKTWKNTDSLPSTDRESVVIDRTRGKYGGKVYVSGVRDVKGIDGGVTPSIHLYSSTDGGVTFFGPAQRATIEGGSLLATSNSVVLSDGTFATMTAHIKKGRTWNLDENTTDRSANVQLQLLTSTDGGRSMNPAVTVSEWFMDRVISEGGIIAQLGVDPGSRYFKDRLYAVWPDAATGRLNIRFAYSVDKGATWSVPITVNDDRPPVEKDRGPDHMLPTIGVNKDGVVLVAWYDRRESADNMGWKIRAAASLDGGVTFGGSTPVSDVASAFTSQTEWVLESRRISVADTRQPDGTTGRPIAVDLRLNGFFVNGGHTSGMAVDAEGVFHPVWIDNRTGVAQLWTAPITVRGSVEKNGASELADLDDITNKVKLEAESTSYDRTTNTLTLTARLRNSSKVTVRGPLKVRVITLTSQLGVPSVVGAENGVTTIGAIWDFGTTVPAFGLLPDSAIAPRILTFRLSDLRPIRLVRESPGFTSGLVHFDARVYGKTVARDRPAP